MLNDKVKKEKRIVSETSLYREFFKFSVQYYQYYQNMPNPIRLYVGDDLGRTIRKSNKGFIQAYIISDINIKKTILQNTIGMLYDMENCVKLLFEIKGINAKQFGILLKFVANIKLQLNKYHLSLKDEN